MPSWVFKEESNRGETYRDSKKKQAQIKKNDNRATQDVKVQEGTTERKCVAGPYLTRAEVKKTDKIHPLKAMSSVNKSAIEDLQKMDSTFDQIEKLIIRENYVEEFFMKNGLLYQKHQETNTG